MNRSESRYFATAAKMDEALLALLGKKDFEYITVKEICQAAGVNRSTFYLHYETIGDLVGECVGYLNQRFLTYIGPEQRKLVDRLKDCPLDELYLMTPEYIAPYLGFIKEYRCLFRVAVRNAAVLRLDTTYDRMFRNVFTPILDRFGVPEADRGYMMSFYIRGLMAIVEMWLGNDCADPEERITELMRICVGDYGNLKIKE